LKGCVTPQILSVSSPNTHPTQGLPTAHIFPYLQLTFSCIKTWNIKSIIILLVALWNKPSLASILCCMTFNHLTGVLSTSGARTVGFLPLQTTSLLEPVKDDMARTASSADVV
jgi:hypothetical protein